jgi:hypothetical protein
MDKIIKIIYGFIGILFISSVGYAFAFNPDYGIALRVVIGLAALALDIVIIYVVATDP